MRYEMIMLFLQQGHLAHRVLWNTGEFIRINNFGNIIDENYRIFTPNKDDLEANDWKLGIKG